MDKFIQKDELSPEDQERLARMEKALVGRELTILLQVLMAEYTDVLLGRSLCQNR